MYTKFDYCRDYTIKILDPWETLSLSLILVVEMPGDDHFNGNIVKWIILPYCGNILDEPLPESQAKGLQHC